MSEHERYADWDGAYVVGALAPSERAEYERHLDGCLRCQDAVAELAPLPGLLARVDPDTLDSVDELPPADLERRLMEAARPPWWRRTSSRVALGLAAAAAVVAAVVVPMHLGHDHAAGQVAVALRSTAGSNLPLHAEVALAPEQWGTRVDMTCTYAAAGGAYTSRAYALYVYDADGHKERVSTWRSGPGETARTAGSTDLSLGDITRVELRDVATDTVLLSSSA
ncbi:zf-HC2 domain-containing protein [Nocardioides sp. BP30]|uniref:anti-sigma factor family protein n=1 Tax=Nocardioides sp. BP30 TaxID=3036374 RepID=UPI00246921E0|nr:zf-HC2 domain-containing protein [Nocardioides sp. BP30]WGL52999.1 zf-HC2 domain-containing protein [Nocardioides sp. BP30]